MRRVEGLALRAGVCAWLWLGLATGVWAQGPTSPPAIAPQPAPQPGDGLLRDPASMGFDPRVFEEIAPRIERAIAERQMPGCVVACGRSGGLVYLQAFGNRAVEPDRVPMTIDTVFDLASLTKPIATATSIHLLAERGRLALTDPVARHLPGFEQRGKHDLTLLDLLTHRSGLLADNALSDYQHGPEESLRRICGLGLK
ncbi:MAG: serine hydrolase domain-containing protein, partial [Planctomycetaceae bacterium]